MPDERRRIRDRRAHPRNGRRTGEPAAPWYRRRRVWLAVASLVFVGWRRVSGRLRGADAP